MAKSQLTFKQEQFVAAYLGVADGNATEAARMAGYKQPKQQGSRLLTNVDIAARVSDRVEKVAASADDVLRELADVALADWREFIEVLGRDREGKPTKVRMDLSNKVKALELLAKYHGLLTEKQQIDITIREHRVIGVQQADLDAMFAPAPPRELSA